MTATPIDETPGWRHGSDRTGSQAPRHDRGGRTSRVKRPLAGLEAVRPLFPHGDDLMASNLMPSGSSRKPRSITVSNHGRRHSARPSLEPLEGRLLMTLIPLKGTDGTTAPAVLVSSGTQSHAAPQQSIGEADGGNYAAAWNDFDGNVYTRLYRHDGSALTPATLVGQTYANYV